MITQCPLPLKFDAGSLLADLCAIEQMKWIQHFVSQNYQGQWTALALRSHTGKTEDIHASPHPQDAFQDTPLLTRSPYFQQVLSSFECPVSAARLMRLGPGSEIKEHRDTGSGYEHGDLRLHIPITTNPQVEFFLGGQRVDMQPGSCWYLNFSLPHRVINGGTSDRVHLVIDCILNPWLDAMFTAIGFGPIERHGTKESMLDNHIAGLSKLDTPAARLALATLMAQKAEILAARKHRQQQAIALPTPSE